MIDPIQVGSSGYLDEYFGLVDSHHLVIGDGTVYKSVNGEYIKLDEKQTIKRQAESKKNMAKLFGEIL